MRAKRSLQLWLDEETHQRIHKLAEESRVPMAVILRDALPGALDVWARARGLVEPPPAPPAPPRKARAKQTAAPAPTRRWVVDDENE